MGAGGKMEAGKVKVTDISKTKNCYLAKAVKRRLKEAGIDKGVKAVYSYEIQDPNSLRMTDGSNFKNHSTEPIAICRDYSGFMRQKR